MRLAGQRVVGVLELIASALLVSFALMEGPNLSPGLTFVLGSMSVVGIALGIYTLRYAR